MFVQRSADFEKNGLFRTNIEKNAEMSYKHRRVLESRRASIPDKPGIDIAKLLTSFVTAFV